MMKNFKCTHLGNCSDMEDACFAHLVEGYVPKCTFTKEDIKESRWYPKRMIMSKMGDGLGQCVDWDNPEEEK